MWVKTDGAKITFLQMQRVLPFGLMAFFAIFGFWKNARYHQNIANGCEITVATTEARVIPYLGYGISVVLILVARL
jgi:hypothetical protein